MDQRSEEMKRIVICADGTWNERDRIDDKTGRRHPTNVTKVARGVLPQAADGTVQVVYYHEGVGTSGRARQIHRRRVRRRYRGQHPGAVSLHRLQLRGRRRDSFSSASAGGRSPCARSPDS